MSITLHVMYVQNITVLLVFLYVYNQSKPIKPNGVLHTPRVKVAIRLTGYTYIDVKYNLH